MSRFRGNIGEIPLSRVPNRINGFGSYVEHRLLGIGKDIVRAIKVNGYLRGGNWVDLRKSINGIRRCIRTVYVDGERLTPVLVVSVLSSVRATIREAEQFIGEDPVLRRLMKEVESIERRISYLHDPLFNRGMTKFDFEFKDESSDLTVLGFYKAWMACIYLFFLLSMKFGLSSSARDLVSIVRDVPRFFGQLRSGRTETIPSYSMAKRDMERRARQFGQYEDEFEQTWVRVVDGFRELHGSGFRPVEDD